jgi:hypothetical protein
VTDHPLPAFQLRNLALAPAGDANDTRRGCSAIHHFPRIASASALGKDLIAFDLRQSVEDSTIRRMNIVSRIVSIITLSGLPRALLIGIYGLVGVAIGMVLVLTRIANATSYLSDDPRTCINCHVMTDAGLDWMKTGD